MLNATETTLDLAQGGGFFTPMKFIAKAGGDTSRIVLQSGPRGIKASSVVTGVQVVDRPKQIARIAGTGAAVAGVTAGAVALAPGHGANDQMPSIEQLTGLE